MVKKKTQFKSSKRELIFLRSIIGVGILLTLIVVFFNPGRKLGNKSKLTPTPVIIDEEATKWKIFSTENVSFRYPPRWQVDNVVKRVYSPDNSGIIIYAINQNEKYVQDQCFEIVDVYDYDNLTVTRLKSIITEATYDYCWGVGMENNRRIRITKKGETKNPSVYFEYTTEVSESAEKILKQILPTVSLVTHLQPTIVGQKMTTPSIKRNNTLFKIEFNIPGGWEYKEHAFDDLCGDASCDYRVLISKSAYPEYEIRFFTTDTSFVNCSFENPPENLDEWTAYIPDYTELNTGFGTVRFAQPANEMNIVCQNNVSLLENKSKNWVGVTNIGFVGFNIPKNPDPKIVQQLYDVLRRTRKINL